MNKNILLLMAILWVAANDLAIAETIILKNGTKFEGTIISDEPSRVQLDIGGGVPRTFYRDEIEKITGGKYGESLQDVTAKPVKSIAEIPEGKKNLILRLLEANGAKENMSKTFDQMVASVPPQSAALVREAFKVDELIKEIIPLYDKYFTEQELRDLVAFYSSATGQRLIQTTPYMLKDVTKISVEYFKRKAPVSAFPPSSKP